MRSWHSVVGLAIVLYANTARAEDGVGALRPAVSHRGWQVDLTGYVQADSVAYSQESVDEVDPDGNPLNKDRFLIRRGILRVEARRDGYFGVLEFDGNTVAGSTARLTSAAVGWSYGKNRALPLLVVSAGLIYIPFGVEVPTNPRDKSFLEAPAFARALFPGNFDAGVKAAGGYGLARWSVALMNGAPVGDAQWRGRDPASGFDVVGRVGLAVDAPRKWKFELGASALGGTGLHPGTPATKDQLQWFDDNNDGFVQESELRAVPGEPAVPSQTYSRDALGLDAQAHWCLCKLGNGTAFVEGVLATNLDRGLVYADPVAQSRDLRELGVSLGVVQDLGEHALVGIRYDRYNADRDATEQAGLTLVQTKQVFSTVSVMATARWGRDAKLLVQYDRERNPFGRDDAGAPATRSADRFTIRGQVGF